MKNKSTQKVMAEENILKIGQIIREIKSEIKMIANRCPLRGLDGKMEPGDYGISWEGTNVTMLTIANAPRGAVFCLTLLQLQRENGKWVTGVENQELGYAEMHLKHAT